MTYLVSVPVLDSLVFTNRPEVMTILLERNLHDRVVVSIDRPMTITKVHSPDLDILVGRPGDNQLRVGRNVERENG